jgi:acetyl-CoA synthetase
MEDLERLWRDEALSRVSWFKPFDQVLEWNPPYARWFLGGRLNVCYNCVDRHVEAGKGDRVAFYWEGEPEADRRAITFAELQREVTRFANGLKELGVGRGTPVGIAMGMIPELPVAMLACARLGAPHVVAPGGLDADSLQGRLVGVDCKVLVTQDEGWRRGSRVPLKNTADDALARSPGVEHCVVARRTGGHVAMAEGRDVWWHALVAGVADHPASCPCEEMDSEDLLCLLHSDPPRDGAAIVHSTAGYLVGVATTHHSVLAVEPDSVCWCAADVGSAAGHGYVVYGPLCNGTTGVLYEGPPDHSDRDRWRHIVERYRVDVLCTSVSDWCRAETGMILMAPKPLPGVEVAVLDDRGAEVGPGGAGYLVLKRPWPAMPRGLYRDHDRYVATYWSRFPGRYFAGDRARVDEAGDCWLLGRAESA